MHLTAYEMIENAKKGLHRGKGGKHFISNMVKYVRYSKKMMIEQFILGLARNFQSKTIFLILQFQERKW